MADLIDGRLRFGRARTAFAGAALLLGAAIMPASASAAAMPNEPLRITLGPWTIRSFSPGGTFRRVMTQGQPEIGSLFLGLDDEGQMLVGFDHPARPDPRHNADSVNIWIDGTEVDLTPLSGQYASDTAFPFHGLWDVPALNGAGSWLEGARRLDYRMASFAKSSDLDRLKEGVANLRTCDRLERGPGKADPVTPPS